MVGYLLWCKHKAYPRDKKIMAKKNPAPKEPDLALPVEEGTFNQPTNLILFVFLVDLL
jgi:hypothetical protein